MAAIILIAASCDRAETKNTPVTTTSPAGTSTAPSPAAADHRNEALIRVVNAAPSGTNVDLFAGDLLLFDGLGFKAFTPYRAVDGKRYAFALRPAGMARATPLSSNTEDLKNGGFYTAVAMPGDGHGPELRIVNDQLDRPANGKARVRVVNAATDTGKIKVRPAGATESIIDSVDYRSISEYHDVAPLSGALDLVSGDPGTVLTSLNAHLEAGRFYTVVIVGNPHAGSKVEAFLIEDSLTP
jgi:hypothetical protein